MAMSRRLAREEGLFAGTPSGANVVAALRVAERLSPGATAVTILCDSGLDTSRPICVDTLDRSSGIASSGDSVAWRLTAGGQVRTLTAH